MTHPLLCAVFVIVVVIVCFMSLSCIYVVMVCAGHRRLPLCITNTVYWMLIEASLQTLWGLLLTFDCGDAADLRISHAVF